MEDTLLIGSSFGLIPNPVDIIIYILYIIIGQEQDEYEFSCTIIITGFGINPKLLPISRVQPDVSHLYMTITKRLLKQLKCMLEQQSFEVQKAFSEELVDLLSYPFTT